jgi:hypothetical protein
MEIKLDFTAVMHLLQLPSVTFLYGLSGFKLNSPLHFPVNSHNPYVAGGMYLVTM